MKLKSAYVIRTLHSEVSFSVIGDSLNVADIVWSQLLCGELIPSVFGVFDVLP